MQSEPKSVRDATSSLNFFETTPLAANLAAKNFCNTMNALLGWKLSALAALLAAAVLGGFVPLYWKRLRDSPVALGYTFQSCHICTIQTFGNEYAVNMS